MELCIDFGGTEIKLAVIDGGRTGAVDGARVVASDAVPVRGDAGDLAAAAAAARILLERAGANPDAVGIAVPGVVSPSTGRMLHANAKYEFLRELDLAAWAVAQFRAPVAVENDARAALVGETDTGSAAGQRDAVLVTLGTGIGTAAMIDGIPLRGRSGHAGILGGHLTVDLDGPRCPCGNLGCGEALASTRALREIDAGLDMREVFADAARPDLRDRFLHVWGAVVTNLVHAYDPSIVILSGGILRAGSAVSAPIEAYAREHLWPSVNPPRFVVPPQPELSVARGLSVLARRAAEVVRSRSAASAPADPGSSDLGSPDPRIRHNQEDT